MPFYTKDPWRQVIILMVMTACVLGVFPQEAFASGPQSRPVFYYYHTDHLGSSSILTDRDGSVVQHYEYTAFGKSRFTQESAAFKVIPHLFVSIEKQENCRIRMLAMK